MTVVGALAEGQVPSAAVPELLRVTKPGEGVSPAVTCLLGPPGWLDRDNGSLWTWVVAQPGCGLVPTARCRQDRAVAPLALPAGRGQARRQGRRGQ